MLLHGEGKHFVNKKGEVVRLQGVVACCFGTATSNPTKEFGWPLNNEKLVRLVKQYGGNYAHMRLGPHTRENEGAGYSGYAEPATGLYDLEAWDESFWDRAAAAIQAALDARVYQEVDLVDGWVRKNPAVDPWSEFNNLQGEHLSGGCLGMQQPFLTTTQERWIRKAVAETGWAPNVIYQISNESGACKVNDEWERHAYAVVRDEEQKQGYERHMIGTNSEHDSLEGTMDYMTFHKNVAEHTRTVPVMVNEYVADSLDVAAFRREVAASARWGTSFHLWRGEADEETFAGMLAEMQASIEGRGLIVPAECPPLTRWRVKVFQTLDAGFQETPGPVRDGYVKMDSTPWYTAIAASGPCNAEHDNCGGRRCEPRNGPEWSQIAGPPGTWHFENEGYSLRIGGNPRRGGIPLAPGEYTFQVCPPVGVTDGEEPPVPLEVGGSACSKVTFVVA